ncbi:hypothetical protein DB345_21130 [Spartobacteria bacterium LR76]|nr:hypothetical protein DB345_21130 [Spartobacteria bacterium LR76]
MTEETQYPCYTATKKTNSFLALRISNTRQYFLPYHHLLAGEVNIEESGGIKTEYITLEFAAHVARIEGSNLSQLVADLREMKVRTMRILPESRNSLNAKMLESSARVTLIDVAYRHDDNQRST